MTYKRPAMFAALTLVFAAVPAAASAQLQLAPGKGDNIGDAIDLGSLKPSPAVAGFDADTSAYTTQPALNEFNKCGSSVYGKTIWSTFKTPRTGQLDVTAAGFDAAIGLARQTSSSVVGGRCTDRLAGRIESYGRNNLPTVVKGQTYFLQVGGAQQRDGSFAGGPLEVAVELLKPQVVNGADAGLNYKFGKGGIKVSSVRVSGPRGSSIIAFCAKKCGKRVTIRPRTAVSGPVQRVRAARRLAPGTDNVFAAAPRSDVDSIPVSAAARQIFKGRKIRNGNTLFVAVVAKDQIGQIFFWKIKKNAAGPKQIGCIEPTSNKVKRVGACNGS
jgi:hypothetical protein